MLIWVGFIERCCKWSFALAKTFFASVLAVWELFFPINWIQEGERWTCTGRWSTLGKIGSANSASLRRGEVKIEYFVHVYPHIPLLWYNIRLLI